jgi:hypothetical protein
MLISALSHVDPVNDEVDLVIDLVGDSPFQHEFLKAVFKDQLSNTADEKDEVHGKPLGPEDIRIRLPFKTVGAFKAAADVIENQRRASLGLPSLEQEAKDKAAQDAASKPAPVAAPAPAKASPVQ